MSFLNTWVGGTDTDFGTAANWSTEEDEVSITNRVPVLTDDVLIPNVTNDPVLDTPRTINSLSITSGGSLDGNNHELTIDGKADGTGATTDEYSVKNDGIITGTDTDLTLTYAGSTRYDLAGTSGTFRNVTINHSSHAATLYTNLVISGDLTITAGSLDTRSGSNNAITVAANCEITGTLICNASTVATGHGYIRSGCTFT